VKPVTESCSIFGLPCEVEFDYQPEEKATREYPGCDECYEITAVRVTVLENNKPNVIDIIKHLNDEAFDNIIDQLKDKRCE
jgi:hypothetical protein